MLPCLGCHRRADGADGFYPPGSSSRATPSRGRSCPWETPMLHDFWHNFTHNLFKPLLLFFYLGFLLPILRVRLEFPYAIYQVLTMYLLLAIGWRGGEELAMIKPANVA